MTRKVILIGIDGASWSIIAPRIASGQLPAFKRIISRGTVSALESTVPPGSPPAWTSIFTGVNPGIHGITDFMLREKDAFVPCWSKYRMTKTIWQILSQLGKKCVVINDPVTYPPDPINGIMITGMMTPSSATDWVYPQKLEHQINAVAHGYQCDIPPDFLKILERDPVEAANLIHDIALKTHRVGKYIAANYPWDVLAVIFTSSDRLQHHWWMDSAVISKHYATLDSMLSEYVELAKEHHADLIVISDHGFGPINKEFRMDKWIEGQGLAVYKESAYSRFFYSRGITRDKVAETRKRATGRPLWLKVFDKMPEVVQNTLRSLSPTGKRGIDLKKSIAYLYPGSFGVFILDDSKLDVVIQKLKEAKDDNGENVFQNVVLTKEVLHGPYTYRAADIFAHPYSGYDLVFQEMEHDTRRTGTHGMEGIFIHYRPDAQPSMPAIKSIKTWDVAAQILDLLEVPIPTYFDGEPKRIFE